jgi:hypothetical protein
MTYANSTAMKVNALDYLVFPIYLIACMVALGLLTAAPFGFDLAAALDLGGGHRISFAAFVALGCLAYVAYTNDWSGHLSWVQGWIIVATITLIVAPPFVPLLAESIAAAPAAFVALAVQAGGYMAFSFVG